MALQPFAPPQSVVHEVMARPICPFPSPASCRREMKRIGEVESAEDDLHSYRFMLDEAARLIAKAQKVLVDADGSEWPVWGDQVDALVAETVEVLGGTA